MLSYTYKWLLITIILTLPLAGCTPAPDEAQITEHIHAMAHGIEARQSDEILDRLNEEFRSSRLKDKKEVNRLLMLSFLKYKNISILLTNIQVVFDATYQNRAQATFNAVATSSSGLIPHDGQIYQLDSQWEKRDGDWYMQALEWKRSFE